MGLIAFRIICYLKVGVFMYILILILFIFTCCLGVYFFINLKYLKDEINELYDLVFKLNEDIGNLERNLNKKDKVIKYDRYV